MFTRIKAQQLQARKDKNTTVANVLTTIIGEFARSKSKDAPTDEQVFKTLTSMRESISQTFASFPTPELQTELDTIDALLKFKPAAASAEDVTKAVEDFIATNSGAKVGDIMKHLKVTFGTTLDGKAANQIVTSVLAR